MASVMELLAAMLGPSQADAAVIPGDARGAELLQQAAGAGSQALAAAQARPESVMVYGNQPVSSQLAGEFRAPWFGTPYINVGQTGDEQPGLTVGHELGHFLDYLHRNFLGQWPSDRAGVDAEDVAEGAGSGMDMGASVAEAARNLEAVRGKPQEAFWHQELGKRQAMATVMQLIMGQKPQAEPPLSPAPPRAVLTPKPKRAEK